MEIRKIGISEYLMDAGELRSALSDYYVNLDRGAVLMIGAFDDSADMVALLHAYDGDDVCAMRNLTVADDRAEAATCDGKTEHGAVLAAMFEELAKVCKADTIEWVVESDADAKMPEKWGWEKTGDRCVFTINPHDKIIANLAKPVIIAHKRTVESMSKKGIGIVSFEDFEGDVREAVLAVTEEAKTTYVEPLFDGAKGTIDRARSYVLIKKGEIISYIINTMRNNSNLENVYIYTPINRRGNGYARFLTSHMVGVMCDSDYDAIRFYVDETNVPSLSMVRKYLGKLVRMGIQTVYVYTRK